MKLLKNLFKLLNNAVYGKTMENMRKRMQIRTTTNEKYFLKYASRTTYIGHKKFGNKLVVIHEKKELLTLKKPIYVKKKCKKYILLFTNTDSLCFENEEVFYEIVHKFNELFDLSNFPKDSKCFRNDNKKVPGKMKDEYGGTIICEFIGPKPNNVFNW